MPHIFISPYDKPLAHWKNAFPELVVLPTNTSLPEPLSGRFWLHYAQPDLPHLTHTLAKIKQRYPNSGTVVLSNVPSEHEGLAALQAGAMGYCHSMAIPAILRQVDAVIHHGGLWVGEKLLQRLTHASIKMLEATQEAATNIALTQHPHQALLAQLSPRECSVALAVANGANNKEIAWQLNIAERTVKAHLSAVFEKLAVRDRLQLVLTLRQPTQNTLPA